MADKSGINWSRGQTSHIVLQLEKIHAEEGLDATRTLTNSQTLSHRTLVISEWLRFEIVLGG
jgi:hypothetical protein